MVCGLPVIATQVGGNPELITAGETGSLVPAADYLQLEMEQYVGVYRRVLRLN